MSQWSNGICGCFGDVTTCLLSFFLPCVQFGRNAETVGENCLMYGLSQLVPLLNIYCRTVVRGKIRNQKGIDGTCFNDLLCHLFCMRCALAQEGQEILAPGGQPMARE
ncbi:PREDICTED: cell number regulator 10-like [Amphimedon queenslandica]|uniref:Uncharacterized protein n=1 Tax=Amphimedon queenslandica TaxID=400682 RepID=A0A1X7VVU8_AMPQE|nr:PREDICTED: cell number regulator 10-like [Amphimedon queenslandica]|eukprot:XP_019859379.1 PREDICTED: cell number regulator 10-like [Amphimedon queenslandica]